MVRKNYPSNFTKKINSCSIILYENFKTQTKNIITNAQISLQTYNFSPLILHLRAMPQAPFDTSNLNAFQRSIQL